MTTNAHLPNADIFIGRDQEISQLTTIINRVRKEKKTEYVLISGEFGVGKTALVAHFLAGYRQDDRVMIASAKCTTETDLNSLLPFSQLLMNTVRREVSAERAARFIVEVAPAWLDIIALGIPGAIMTTIKETRKLLPEQKQIYSQENVFVQFTNAIRELAAQRELLVCFLDDLQWADESSLYLLAHLSNELRDVPVIFICAYRTVSALETSRNAPLFRRIRSRLVRNGAIEIEITAGIQASSYIAHRYQSRDFPAQFVETVQRQTGGHPLFISQVFSLWEETGRIVCSDYGGHSVWKLSGTIDEVTVPREIGYVLEERIRLMTDELRRILTIASIEGEDFTLQVLLRLDQLEDLFTCDQIDILEKNYRMIKLQEAHEVNHTTFDFYRFTHRFFREYIYEQLSPAKKRILHLNVGNTLEDLYEADRDIVAAQLAFHFREAHEWSRALEYALKAARFEQRRYGWLESRKLCLMALGLINDSSIKDADLVKADILDCLAFGYYHTGKYKDALKAYSDLLNQSESFQLSPEKLGSYCAILADIGDNTRLLKEAQEFIETGNRKLSETNSRHSEAQIELNISQAQIHIRLGRLQQAAAILHESLELADRLPQVDSLKKTLVRGYNTLGIVLGNLNLYLEAEEAFVRARTLAGAVGEFKFAIDSTLNLASDYYERVTLLEKADELVSEALELAEKIGDLDGVAYAYNTRAQVTLASGRPEQAINYFERAIKMSRDIGALWNMPYMYADLARAHLALFNAPKAKQCALMGVKYTSPTEYVMGYVLEPLARAEAMQKNFVDAEKYFQQAISIFDRAGHRHYVARTKMYWAESMIDSNSQEAEAILKSVLPVFQEMGLAYDTEMAHGLLERAKASKTGHLKPR